ncbi:hypothetical protein [Larkinella soli]|uniref:hypothetical protein n=1 Tax=Larkinella soli TaxID=1770527 RepID=UPI000FFBC5C5|nr:hypothetical protein [Larkinella soli]
MFLPAKHNAIRYLHIATVSYMVLPALLFLLTWVRPSIGLPCVVLLCGMAAYIFTRPRQTAAGYSPALNRKNVLIASVLTFVYLLVYGFGEFNWQLFDFQFHNAKYHDLIVNSWPVYYPKYNTYMCYYNAYYLPVAFLSKFLGIGSARYLALLWTWAGLLLVCGWVLSLSPKRPWRVFLVLFIFCNSWVFIWAIRAAGLALAYLPPNYIDLGNFPIILMSPFSDHLVWAPQHTIPALLAALSLTSFYRQRQAEWLPMMALQLGGALFWGPFAVVGSFPFVLYLFWLDRRQFLKKPLYLLLPVLTGLGLLPVAIYLTSTQITSDPAVNMFITQTGLPSWPFFFLLYILTNFVIWYVPLRWLTPNDRQLHPWLTVAILSLCVLPLYRLGIMNDWQMRTNIPAYSILILFSAQWLVNYQGPRQWIRWGFIVFWAVNGLSTLKFTAAFLPPHPTNTFISHPSPYGDETTPDLAVRHYNPATAGQYLLRSDSLFEKYFMSPPAARNLPSTASRSMP